mmetsp:Transcript_50138/g.150942  ORF Transcript_50138/g.150942 Transcript_50138/m.150942 type:complete len:216 (+) Transcript_50138:96-743(+)
MWLWRGGWRKEKPTDPEKKNESNRWKNGRWIQHTSTLPFQEEGRREGEDILGAAHGRRPSPVVSERRRSPDRLGLLLPDPPNRRPRHSARAEDAAARFLRLRDRRVGHHRQRWQSYGLDTPGGDVDCGRVLGDHSTDLLSYAPENRLHPEDEKCLRASRHPRHRVPTGRLRVVVRGQDNPHALLLRNWLSLFRRRHPFPRNPHGGHSSNCRYVSH